MRRHSAAGAVAFALILVACGPGGEPTTTADGAAGASSPEAAVTELAALLAGGDFEQTAGLTIEGQAALASLAEGTGFAEVAMALEEGDSAVAANFWSGFAQGANDLLTGEVTIVDEGLAVVSDVEFQTLQLVGADAVVRRLVTREVDGHQIDIFASFGAILAGRMLSPVEILVGSSTADAIVILDALSESVPSLLMASEEEGIPAESAQDILQLIELITRIG